MIYEIKNYVDDRQRLLAARMPYDAGPAWIFEGRGSSQVTFRSDVPPVQVDFFFPIVAENVMEAYVKFDEAAAAFARTPEFKKKAYATFIDSIPPEMRAVLDGKKPDLLDAMGQPITPPPTRGNRRF